MFLLLLHIVSGEVGCVFKKSSYLSSLIAENTAYTRNLASFLGYPTSNEPHDLAMVATGEKTLDDAMPYIYGVAGFAAPVIIITVLLILYFFVGQILACTKCFAPKARVEAYICNSRLHIIMAILIFVSAGFFYFASAEMTGGLTETGKVPGALLTAVETLDDAVNTSINGALVLIEDSVGDAKVTFENFSSYLNRTLDDARTASTSVGTNLDSNNDTLDNIQDSAKNFDDIYDTIAEDCDLVKYNLEDSVVEMSERIRELSEKLSIFAEQYDEFVALRDSIETSIDSIMVGVNDQVENFTNVTIPELVDPLDSIFGSLRDISINAGSTLGTISKYTNVTIYSVVSFFLVVGFLYLFLFFCNNGFARCIMASFCSFALFITILLGVPTIIFSFVFFLFYDLCPSLDSLSDSIGLQMFGNRSELSSVLTCPQTLPDRSIFILANLISIFDYVTSINDLSQSLQDSFEAINPGETTNLLNNALSVNLTRDFSRSNLQGFDTEAIRVYINSIEGCPSLDNPKKDLLEQYLGEIDSNYNLMQSKITLAANSAGDVIGYASTMKPNISNTVNLSVSLVTDLSAEMINFISTNINRLECDMICQVYSPAKNAVCVYLVDGMAYWLLSTVIALVAFAVLSYTICNRRKGMLPLKVYDGSSSSKSESSSGRHHKGRKNPRRRKRYHSRK